MKSSISILIADDEELFREYLKTVVDWRKNGFEIICEAKTGLQALEMARHEHPDVMLIDINMPHLDGLTLIDMLQKEEIDALFVLVTGVGDFEHAQRAIKLQVFDYLLKPFSQEELLHCLAKLRRHIESLRIESTSLKQQKYLQQIIFEETDGKECRQSDFYKTIGWEMPACLHFVKDDPPKKASWAYLLVQRAINYLCKHYNEDLSIDSIARELFVSQSYLRKVFANELKTPVMHTLLEIRMDRAARMLAEGTWKIASVAEQTGYSDPAYFSRVFHKYFGMTPTAFEVISCKRKL